MGLLPHGFYELDYCWLERLDYPKTTIDFLKRARYYLIEKETENEKRPSDFMNYLSRSMQGLLAVDRYAFDVVIYTLMAHDMDYTYEACSNLYAKLFDVLAPRIARGYKDKAEVVEQLDSIKPISYTIQKVKDLVYQIVPPKYGYE